VRVSAVTSGAVAMGMAAVTMTAMPKGLARAVRWGHRQIKAQLSRIAKAAGGASAEKGAL
jgi:glutamate 5-kinase